MNDQKNPNPQPHPLVTQLWFTRREWARALSGVMPEEALRRFEPLNSIGWIVGHLAWHEQFYWLKLAQGKTPHPELNDLVATGRPATTPPLDAMQAAWKNVTTTADRFLVTLTPADLPAHIIYKDRPLRENTGTMLQRLIYHYWFHIGEIMAIRQLLGHRELPEFVGALGQQAPYRPESR